MLIADIYEQKKGGGILRVMYTTMSDLLLRIMDFQKWGLQWIVILYRVYGNSREQAGMPIFRPARVKYKILAARQNKLLSDMA
jgi:hypothetical protein